MKMKLASERCGRRTTPSTARRGWFGGKLSPAGREISAACGAAALAADANSRCRDHLPWLVCGVRVSGGLRKLWARCGGITLAFAVFASAMLCPAPVWSQMMSGTVLSFVASTTVVEGGDDVELRIGVLLNHVGRRVEIELTGSGTAVRGTDYSLIAADPAQGIALGDGITTITLRVDSVPDEPLRLLLRPRGGDRFRQGDRFLNLRISSYRVVPESGGTVALPPALDFTIVDDEPPTVQQILVGQRDSFICVHLDDRSVRCVGNNSDGRSTPPADLGPVAQLGVGAEHSCALTISGQVRCWGSDEDGRSSPPENLGTVAQLAVGFSHSCVLTVLGEVLCWGSDRFAPMPPMDLDLVAQLAVSPYHNCAVTDSGEVRCWGENGNSQSSPTVGLDPVAQLAVSSFHSCALTVSGEVRCWGRSFNGESSPPEDLAPVAQIGVGNGYSCALTVSGEVRCWGYDGDGRSSPPVDLGQVVQLSVGEFHSCALTVSGQLRCWGSLLDVLSLPPGLVAAVETRGRCALLADGTAYCPLISGLVPPELRPSVVMSVWPRQLGPGQRAAIRFSALQRITGAFTARIEVYGEGSAEIGSDYRLLDSSGTPLEAKVEADGSYRYQLQGNPPMGWLEATDDDRSALLYVRPLELLSASGPAPSIRKVAQSIELIDRLSFTASTETLVEGGEEVQLGIVLPLAHSTTSLRVELELTVSGTALAGSAPPPPPPPPTFWFWYSPGGF